MPEYVIQTTDEQDAALQWEYAQSLAPPAPPMPPPLTAPDAQAFLQMRVNAQILDPMVNRYLAAGGQAHG